MNTVSENRTKSLLYLDGVSVSFDGFRALNSLSFVVEPGELRAIIGPNGAGKTTMMDIITGKTRPDEGTVMFGGSVDLLAESDLPALQDRRETVRERFDLGLETGAAQLAKQGLEGFADDAVFQDVILGDRQFCAFLRQAEKLDGLVGVRLIVSHCLVSRCSGFPGAPRECGGMAECLVSESARVRDGAAAG